METSARGAPSRALATEGSLGGASLRGVVRGVFFTEFRVSGGVFFGGKVKKKGSFSGKYQFKEKQTGGRS